MRASHRTDSDSVSVVSRDKALAFMKLTQLAFFVSALVVLAAGNPIDEWDDYDYDSLEDLEPDSTTSRPPVTPKRSAVKPAMGLVDKLKNIFLLGLKTAIDIIEPIPGYF